MADRILTFTSRIFLNDDQAKNKIRELEKGISTIRAAMEKAADAGEWSKFNSLKKKLNQSTKELNSMRTTAQSVAHVLNNLSSTSIKEIKRTISAINKELANGSVARNSHAWQFLTEQLERAKKELRNVNQANELVNKKDKWQWLENMNKIGFAITNFFGLEQGISGIISKVTSLAQESMEVAKQAEGIEIAFQRINKPGLLENLRKETHNTVNDMQLMQQAVKFANFDLPVEQLGKLLAFAHQQAKDTGESLDYMVNSLVDGMTRQSPKILDNLGLSAQKIKEKSAETGDFVQGVIAIIQERMEKTGDYVETAADRAAKANAGMVNAQMELGKQLSPIRAQMAGIFGKAKLGMIETITWILKNRDTLFSLARVIGVVAIAIGGARLADKLLTAELKINIIWQRVKVALDKTELTLTKAKTASLLLPPFCSRSHSGLICPHHQWSERICRGDASRKNGQHDQPVDGPCYRAVRRRHCHLRHRESSEGKCQSLGGAVKSIDIGIHENARLGQCAGRGGKECRSPKRKGAAAHEDS